MVHDRQKFAAITLRIAEPMCTVLLFTSGKMVLTGARASYSAWWRRMRCKLAGRVSDAPLAVVDVSVERGW